MKKIILTTILTITIIITGIAATFNVSTVSEFQNALNTAATNGEDDVINVAAGTYNISATLTFNSSENHSLTITGSGNPALAGNNTVQVMNIANYGANAGISISGLVIKNGIADYGGGLYAETDLANISLQNCTIENNTGNIICGGADFYSNSGDISIDNCTFTDNSSPNTTGYPNGTAGGLFVQTEDPGTSITLTNSYFSGNFAQRDAAGAMLYPLGSNSSVTADNNTFDSNTANEFGGGCWIRCPGGNATVEYHNNILTQNKAQNAGSGGGTYIEIESGDINASDNEHTGNTAIWDGGGLWIENQNGTIDLTQNTFTQNQSSQNGGAVNIYLANGTLNISRNTFDSNTATNIGGAMSLSTDNATLNVFNNTTYSNTADSEGGAVYFYFDQAGASSSVYNNIFWNDSSPVIAYSGAQSVIAIYSDISGASSESWFGTGCIDSDPLFADAAASDFHITWANYPVDDATKSPCIDTGDPASAGDPDATTADMGRYYFEQTTLSIDLYYFDVSHFENKVKIQWAANMLENPDFFEVQRSYDAYKWHILTKINAKDTDSKYVFVDKPNANGDVYYRLSVIGRDGEKYYSPVRKIYMEAPCTLSVNNPVTDNFIINYRVNTDGYVKMILYDIKGEKIKNLMSRYIKKGSFSIKEMRDCIPSGMYYLTLTINSNFVCSKPVVIN